MQQSFKARLAVLEALDAAREAEHEARERPGALTVEDCATLLSQIVASNVRIEVDGRAVRQWRCGGDDVTAALDLALRRLNLILADGPDDPCPMRDLALVLGQYVPRDMLPLWIWGELALRFPRKEQGDDALS